MAEKGFFQKGVDGFSSWHRDHKGTDYGVAILAAGTGAAAARFAGAELAIAAGTAVTLFSSGVDYLNNIVEKYIPGQSQTEESTTAIPTGVELPLADFTEEGPTSS